MLRQRGLTETPYHQLRPVASMGARGILGVAFGIGPENERFVALREEFLSNYATNICVHSTLFPGIASLLAHVRNSGRSVGIVTNKSTRLTLPLVALLGLGEITVVCGDTTNHSKPHPAPLLHAASLIETDPRDCIYVGDDLRDIQAGIAAKMQTVAAAWGYCGGLEPSLWGADAVVNTPQELARLLTKAP